MRRLLRWLLRALAGLLLLILVWLLVSALYGWYALGRDASALRPPGRLVDIGGRNLYLYCVGEGRPTVLLESALGAPTVLWQQMQPAIGAHTRVCSYDRDGIGWSDESGAPRSVAHYANDLRRALTTAGEAGPFVMVGHSIGGMLALDYARSYPDDIAGMVLLDPTHPKQFAPGAEQWKDHQQALPIFRAGPLLARMGLVREALWLTDLLKPLPLPAEIRSNYIALMATPKATGALLHEAEALYSLCDSSAVFPRLGDIPLVVLSASTSIDDGFPPAFHEEMAKLSSRGIRRVVEGASHSGLVIKPEQARVAVDAILEVVAGVRAASLRQKSDSLLH